MWMDFVTGPAGHPIPARSHLDSPLPSGHFPTTRKANSYWSIAGTKGNAIQKHHSSRKPSADDKELNRIVKAIKGRKLDAPLDRCW